MRLFLSALIIIFSSHSYSQIADIEIFSNEAEPFRLWVNGVEKTSEPTSVIEFQNLNPGYYEVMAVMTHTNDSIFKKLSFSPNFKTTFVIKKKKKGYTIRFRDENPLRAGQTVISPTPPAKYQVIRPNPNCPEPTGGLDEIEGIRLQLVNLQYDESKLQEAKHLLAGKCFYSLHLINILELVRDDVYRLQLAEVLLNHLVDIDQGYLFARSFAQDHFQQQFLNTWENYR